MKNVYFVCIKLYFYCFLFQTAAHKFKLHWWLPFQNKILFTYKFQEYSSKNSNSQFSHESERFDNASKIYRWNMKRQRKGWSRSSSIGFSWRPEHKSSDIKMYHEYLLVAQRSPMNPLRHVHEKASVLSRSTTQEPPFIQSTPAQTVDCILLISMLDISAFVNARSIRLRIVKSKIQILALTRLDYSNVTLADICSLFVASNAIRSQCRSLGNHLSATLGVHQHIFHRHSN